MYVGSHTITSIAIVEARTGVPHAETGGVERVTYRGVPAFRTDVHFTTDVLQGNQSICFLARDDHK